MKLSFPDSLKRTFAILLPLAIPIPSIASIFPSGLGIIIIGAAIPAKFPVKFPRLSGFIIHFLFHNPPSSEVASSISLLFAGVRFSITPASYREAIASLVSNPLVFALTEPGVPICSTPEANLFVKSVSQLLSRALLSVGSLPETTIGVNARSLFVRAMNSICSLVNTPFSPGVNNEAI